MIWLIQAVPTPTPTEAFDPADVTPGPIGFFATVGMMVAVGLVAMGLMRRSARVQARWQVREQLEREEAAAEASDAGGQTSGDTSQDASGKDASGQDASETDTSPSKEV